MPRPARGARRRLRRLLQRRRILRDEHDLLHQHHRQQRVRPLQQHRQVHRHRRRRRLPQPRHRLLRVRDEHAALLVGEWHLPFHHGERRGLVRGELQVELRPPHARHRGPPRLEARALPARHPHPDSGPLPSRTRSGAPAPLMAGITTALFSRTLISEPSGNSRIAPPPAPVRTMSPAASVIRRDAGAYTVVPLRRTVAGPVALASVTACNCPRPAPAAPAPPPRPQRKPRLSPHPVLPCFPGAQLARVRD